MNKLTLLLFLLCTSSLVLQGQISPCQQQKSASVELWKGYTSPSLDLRSDSVDIELYDVFLDMQNVSTQQIKGACTIHFKAVENNISSLRLDLLELQVDSVVKTTGQSCSFSYNDTLINIQLGQSLQQGDSLSLTVYYQGTPQRDASWGGFYFSGDYAYNLGVGFAADPHNYGRVWHPCFDNFKERARYRFEVISTADKQAHCNGYLLSRQILGNTCTSIWKMDTGIPSYLACVALSKYTTVYQNYQGQQGNVPIELAAKSTDTSNMKASFLHLPQAIGAYEYWYGPHQWNKVGYSAVPFNAGAMEHATNIAYPIYAIDGSLSSEDLMAHELGHSWWGNLVTCERAEDMWINEGMASYSEALFFEFTYGRARYIEEVKDNHYYVLRNAHTQEGGYRAISGVPHQYTYGTHVYKKGASVAHNMRAYLGDSLFRQGLQAVINRYAHQNLNSAEFRDELTQTTGVDMQPFFRDWVFNGGFPHFDILSYTYQNGQLNIVVKQDLVGATAYFEKVPLKLTVYDSLGQQQIYDLELSGALDSFSFNVGSQPEELILNEEHLLNQARFDYRTTLRSAQTFSVLTDVNVQQLSVSNIQDSSYLHIAYHPVGADASNVGANYILSKDRYWSFKGIWEDSMQGSAQLRLSSAIDTSLYNQTGDFVLLYRPTANDTWQEHPSYNLIQLGSLKRMNFDLLKGDYAFGIRQVNTDSKKRNPIKSMGLKVYPNPTQGNIQIMLDKILEESAVLKLYTLDGKLVESKTVVKGEQHIQWNLSQTIKGQYILELSNEHVRGSLAIQLL